MVQLLLRAASSGSSAEGTEDELIAAAQQDIAAFEGIYALYVDRVYRYLAARTSNPEEARDMTQQVFLQVLNGLSRYKTGKTPFGAWLFRIAHNLTVDRYRRQKSHLSWDLLPDIVQLPADQEPEQAMLTLERSQRLRQLIAKLDVQKQELLALRFAGGLSSTEISAVVGKSPAAIKRQMTRILQSLKEAYDA